MISIFRHGINNDDIGPIAKASFEETPEMFLRAARHGELDNMRGVSANVMCGQEGFFGTNAFDVILDFNKINEFNNNEIKDVNENQVIENTLNNLNINNICSIRRDMLSIFIYSSIGMRIISQDRFAIESIWVTETGSNPGSFSCICPSLNSMLRFIVFLLN